MSGLFNLENKFFRTLSKLVDCCALSILWAISCVPLFTVGAATSGLYYAINKVIMHNRSYVWTEYWHGFRTNFKQATAAWLIIAAIAALFGEDIYIMRQFAESGETIGSIFPAFYVLLALLAIWANYIFAYIARFEDKLKRIFRNTAVMAIGHLIWSVVILLLFAFACFLVYLLPELIVIIPAGYMICVNETLERIFQKYMSQEDREAEEERNREYQ